jgi:hypothetical protein
MSRFEDDLRRALREPEPSADLAQKVLARAAQQRRPRHTWLSLKIAAAIGVVGVLSAIGFRYEQRRGERIANERARDQVVEAFRLAEQQLKPFRKSLEAVKTIQLSGPYEEREKNK